MTQSLGSYLQGPNVPAPLASIIADIAGACVTISGLLRTAPLTGLSGLAGSVNVQGESQKPLDVEANRAFVDACRANPALSWGVSEEEEQPIRFSAGGDYAVLFDPLDGSSNLDVNVTVGSIFSIIPARSEAELLRPGAVQVAAGFVAYGPATTLVLSFGQSVDVFVLSGDEFVLSQTGIRIPEDAPEYSINSSREPFWDEGTRRYVADCVRGKDGPLAQRYNMRWVGSMVADIFRILNRGGIFLYPSDVETKAKGGRLRLLYEASPMSFIVRAAGGGATTGSADLLAVTPTSIHQRIPVILGSARQVADYERYVAGE